MNDEEIAEQVKNHIEEHRKRQQILDHDTRVVSASSAGIRAVLVQVQALYLRTPVKLFRPSRFDYLASARHVGDLGDKPYSFRTHSSIALLMAAVKKQGWKFIPDQVLPPLLANSATGIILYSTYLTCLHLSSTTEKSTSDVFRAGFVAGGVQSLAAAPIDAIYTRSTTSELLKGKEQSLWVYGFNKLKEIGLIGVFAGFGVSFVKESLGFAFYFATFELVKNQGYQLANSMIDTVNNWKFKLNRITDPSVVRQESVPNSKSSRFLKSTFILFSGASAAFSLLAIQYPISKIQKIHLSRLEALDIYNSFQQNKPFITLYYNAYLDTCIHVVKVKRKSKLSWFQWGYKGFARNALTMIPSTSIGLLVFEIMRTRLDIDSPLDP